MSNILMSANELSRGLRRYPGIQGCQGGKETFKADEQASKILQITARLSAEIQVMAQTGQVPEMLLSRKDAVTSVKANQKRTFLSDFFAKQQQLSIYLSDIRKKIVFEPVSELLK